MLVEVEHVLDARKTNDLIRGQREPHHRSESVEDGKAVGDGARQGEKCACDGTPKHDGSSTPPGGDHDPDEAANATMYVSQLR